MQVKRSKSGLNGVSNRENYNENGGNAGLIFSLCGLRNAYPVPGAAPPLRVLGNLLLFPIQVQLTQVQCLSQRALMAEEQISFLEQ
jgi:hypothetical protein